MSKLAISVGPALAKTEQVPCARFVRAHVRPDLIMSLQLRNDLHWCECEGRAVFLDMRADRYFCLPAEINGAYLNAARGQAHADDLVRLQGMVDRGLLLTADSQIGIRPAASIDPPTGDFANSDGVHTPGVEAIIRALLAEARTTWTLRYRSLQAALANLQRIRPGHRSTSVPRGRIAEVAAAAQAISVITRSHDRCLVRALAVQSLCRRIGARTVVVFGVVAHPFSAHCWVQAEDLVVVGGWEQARLYTPILVLR